MVTVSLLRGFSFSKDYIEICKKDADIFLQFFELSTIQDPECSSESLLDSDSELQRSN